LAWGHQDTGRKGYGGHKGTGPVIGRHRLNGTALLSSDAHINGG
jgi:hypothetical protein